MKLFVTALLTLLPATALAQDAAPAMSGDQLMSALDTCRTKPDDSRLACYDQAVAKLLSARERRDIRVVDRAAVIRTKRSLFGLSASSELFDGSDAAKRDEAEVKEITTTVTKATDSRVGLWTLALAQGGVWQTLEQSMYFMPKEGDQITLRAELLGRFTAQIGKGRRVTVRRIR